MATSSLCFYIVVVLAHLVVLTKGQTVTCRYADSSLVNGTCFRYNTTKVTWAEAKASCESWNGALAMVNSSAQIKTILKNATAYSDTWIGANDIDVEGTLVWDHDKSPALASLTGLLAAGQPSSYDTYDCAEIYKITATVLQIYVEPCTYQYGFLCMEMPLPTTTSATTAPTDSPTTTPSTTTTTPSTTTTTPPTTTTTPPTTTTTPPTTTTTPPATTTTPPATTTTSTSTTATTTTSTATSSTATTTLEAYTNSTMLEPTTSENTTTTSEEKAIMRGGAEVVKVTVLLYILPAFAAFALKRDGRLNLQ